MPFVVAAAAPANVKNTDRRDDKADDRRQGILPRHLAEMDGEDQVPGPEEHSEQCSGNKNFLPER